MADKIEAKVDLSGVRELFTRLGADGGESLARRMGVAAGRVVRDEAKLRAPESDGPYNETSRGSHSSGQLRDAIFVAYNNRVGGDRQYTYSVSWNVKNGRKVPAAWWGKLVEFGYYRRHVVFQTKDGVFHTKRGPDGKPLQIKSPVYVPPQPFLGPAFEAVKPKLQKIMLDAGRAAFDEVLRGT